MLTTVYANSYIAGGSQRLCCSVRCGRTTDAEGAALECPKPFDYEQPIVNRKVETDGVFGMMVLGKVMSKAGNWALGIVFLLPGLNSLNAQTPAPYLLPYTINTIAGGGTAPAVGAACPGAIGTTGNTGKATDIVGDGCLASSSSVVTSIDLHDVG